MATSTIRVALSSDAAFPDLWWFRIDRDAIVHGELLEQLTVNLENVLARCNELSVRTILAQELAQGLLLFVRKQVALARG